MSDADVQAIAQAIRDAYGFTDNIDEDDGQAARAVLAVLPAAGWVRVEDAVSAVEAHPLNICGYGAPMPADHAASVEDFRAAVVRALRRLGEADA